MCQPLLRWEMPGWDVFRALLPKESVLKETAGPKGVATWWKRQLTVRWALPEIVWDGSQIAPYG
jgi:hypothetical protein